MATPAELLMTALNFQRAGDFARAEQICTGILQADPANADAYYLLGAFAISTGRFEQALNFLDKAISINPANASYHLERSAAYRALGKLDLAKASVKQAIRLEPEFVNAHINLGVLMEQSSPTEAEACYRKALRLQPNSAIAWNNLANVLINRNNLAEAQACLEQATKHKPSYAEAHNGLGSVWHRAGDLTKARACFERAISCNPKYASAHFNLGLVLHLGGQPDQAQACFRRAVLLRPQFVEAYYQWAAVLKEAQQFSEAQTCLEHALQIRPEFCPALTMLASVLEFQGKTREARRALEKAMALEPTDDLKIRSALLLPVIYQSFAHVQEERLRLRHALKALAEEKLSLAEPEQLTAGSPFFLAYQGGNDCHLMRTLADVYARAAPHLQFVAPHCVPGAPIRATGEPIRVGFLTRFAYQHTIGKLDAGFIRHLSRGHFRVILLRWPGPDDALARSIDQSADEVITLPHQLKAARELVAQQSLDVLFYTDIGMDPLTYFMAFSRLAPVQCVTWGHPVTSGIPTMDYFLSCDLIEPPKANEHYSEQLVQLDHINSCYEEPRLVSPAKTRREFGLPENVHLYVCSQSRYKIHPRFDAVLLAILRQDPVGCVVLLSGAQTHWTELLKNRLRETISQEFGRILFLPEQSQPDFLHLQALADVLLDTFPFGGGNTSLEALAFGTPIVTLAESLMRGRITFGCYQQMGITDCIAVSEDDYVRIAVRLGTDPAWRKHVHEKILKHKHLLYNNLTAVQELEHFLHQAVEHVRGKSVRNE